MNIEQMIRELTLSHLKKLHALQIEEQEYRTEQARIALESTRIVCMETRKEGLLA